VLASTRKRVIGRIVSLYSAQLMEPTFLIMTLIVGFTHMFGIAENDTKH